MPPSPGLHGVRLGATMGQAIATSELTGAAPWGRPHWGQGPIATFTGIARGDFMTATERPEVHFPRSSPG